MTGHRNLNDPPPPTGTLNGVNRSQAEKALRAFNRHYQEWKRAGHEMASLHHHPQWDHPDGGTWQIVWTDGPPNWSVTAPALPRPVIGKPHSVSSLSLYHETSDRLHLIGL